MKSYVLGILLIGLVVVALQGASVRYGLLLDDNNHRAELRDGDWSFKSLVMASHLGGDSHRVRMWWQEEADLYFFRPVSFFLMRAEYVLGGWSPAVMHGFSLAWTVLCGALVIGLARSMGLGPVWGTLAGVLFVMHPGNVMTGRWLACQNQQMVTAFALTGLLTYGRYSGWSWQGDLQRERGHWVWLGATLLCFALALGSRESGIMLAPLLVAGDWIARRDRLKGRWHVYALVAIIAVGYFFLRHAMLGGWTMPGRPYAYPPTEPGFARFVFDKFLYYLLGLFAYMPIVASTGLEALRAMPGVLYGGVAVLAGIWIVLLWRLKVGRLAWFGAALMVIPLGPVLPVFASSHHLYLASVGMALLAVGLCRAILAWSRACPSRGRRLVGRLVLAMIGLHLGGFVAANFLHDAGMEGFSAASQLPAVEASVYGGPYEPGDRLFFINLPPLAFNCVPAIEEACGVEPLVGYVLTFSTSLLKMDELCSVERVGDRQLRVAMDGDGYFSGRMGHSMREAIGDAEPFETGHRFSTPDFEVEIVRATPEGVQEFLFTFVRPLDDSSYHFFVGSELFSAYPLRFSSE